METGYYLTALALAKRALNATASAEDAVAVLRKAVELVEAKDQDHGRAAGAAITVEAVDAKSFVGTLRSQPGPLYPYCR